MKEGYRQQVQGSNAC